MPAQMQQSRLVLSLPKEAETAAWQENLLSQERNILRSNYFRNMFRTKPCQIKNCSLRLNYFF